MLELACLQLSTDVFLQIKILGKLLNRRAQRGDGAFLFGKLGRQALAVLLGQRILLKQGVDVGLITDSFSTPFGLRLFQLLLQRSGKLFKFFQLLFEIVLWILFTR